MFDVEVSAGLAAQETSDGGLEITDGSGAAVFSVPAPYMDDAAGVRSEAVSLNLEEGPAGLELHVAPDSQWLEAPGRLWPVVVDPDVVVGEGEPDCSLQSVAPTASFCSEATLQVGGDASGTYRTLLRFDELTEVIPYDAVVVDAGMNVEQITSTTGNGLEVSVHEVTAPWTTSATWDTRDGSTPWATAGGDLDPVAEDTAGIGWDDRRWEFYLPELAAEWVSGAKANHGIMLKADAEPSSNVLSFASFDAIDPNAWPYFYVHYENPVGQRPGGNYETVKVNDHESFSVNVASGNALYTTTDLTVVGAGIDQIVGRAFNSKYGYHSIAGANWSMTSGADVHLDPFPYWDDPPFRSVQFTDATERDMVFFPDGNGGWVTPPGLDATLTHDPASDVWTLADHGSGRVRTFAHPGGPGYVLTLMTECDGDDNCIDYGYDPNGRWTSITDTQGRTTNLDYGPAGTLTSGNVESVTDSTGRSVHYGYTPNQERMTSFTNTDGEVTQYGYDRYAMLDHVVDAAGNEVRAIYDDDDRVTSFTRVTDPQTGTGPTTTFGYSPGSAADPRGGTTTVTAPDGSETLYHYDARGDITEVEGPGNDYAATVLAGDPVAYWRFGEAGGNTAFDEVGAHNAGDVASPVYGQPGAVPDDTAVGLNGGEWFGVSNIDALRMPQMSVEAWVKLPPGDTRSHPIWYQRRYAKMFGHILQVQNGVVAALAHDGDDNHVAVGDRNIADGEWHQVVLTAGAGSVDIYVDGAPEASVPMGDPLYTGRLNDVSIGWRNIGLFDNIHFVGTLDEVSVYDRYLSLAEIRAHYAASGRTPPPLTLEGGRAHGGGSPGGWLPIGGLPAPLSHR